MRFAEALYATSRPSHSVTQTPSPVPLPRTSSPLSRKRNVINNEPRGSLLPLRQCRRSLRGTRSRVSAHSRRRTRRTLLRLAKRSSDPRLPPRTNQNQNPNSDNAPPSTPSRLMVHSLRRPRPRLRFRPDRIRRVCERVLRPRRRQPSRVLVGEVRTGRNDDTEKLQNVQTGTQRVSSCGSNASGNR